MGIWLLIVSYWTTNQKPFLVQILIYKNGMKKWIFREDEKRDQEETKDCQRNIPSVLDPRLSKRTSSDFTKIQVPGFRDISVILTAPHRHSSFLDILSLFLPGKQTSFVCFFIVSQTCFNKNDFLLFVKQRFFSILWVARQSSHL